MRPTNIEPVRVEQRLDDEVQEPLEKPDVPDAIGGGPEGLVERFHKVDLQGMRVEEASPC